MIQVMDKVADSAVLILSNNSKESSNVVIACTLAFKSNAQPLQNHRILVEGNLNTQSLI